MFKDFFVPDIKRTLLFDQASIDGSIFTVHEGLINTEAEINPLNWAAKWNMRFAKKFSFDTTLSFRQIEGQFNIHHTTVRNFIKRAQDVPVWTAKLLGNENWEGTSRLVFAEYCHTQLSTSRSSLKRIIFSDECKFLLSGRVNKQNCRIWGTKRPKQVHEVPQHSPSVMVFCAGTKHEIIGPYFFENENVTQHSYKRMLRYIAFARLRNYP